MGLGILAIKINNAINILMALMLPCTCAIIIIMDTNQCYGPYGMQISLALSDLFI